MAHYSRKSLVVALRKIGVREGDVLFSHSNVARLGIPKEGRSPEVIFDTIFGAFQDVLGSSGTLVVPTFTYSFPRGEEFDPDTTPSTAGAFTEVFRQRSDVRRSHDPCVSVTAWGARAAELTENAPENTYASEGFFARLHRAGGKICNMNLDAGSTFIHYVERQLRVPYRFDKTFEGIVRVKGVGHKRRSTIWVRDLDNPRTEAWFTPFDGEARRTGLYSTAQVGMGEVGMMTCADVLALIEQTLPSRPRFLTAGERAREKI